MGSGFSAGQPVGKAFAVGAVLRLGFAGNLIGGAEVGNGRGGEAQGLPNRYGKGGLLVNSVDLGLRHDHVTARRAIFAGPKFQISALQSIADDAGHDCSKCVEVVAVGCVSGKTC